MGAPDNLSPEEFKDQKAENERLLYKHMRHKDTMSFTEVNRLEKELTARGLKFTPSGRKGDY